MTRTRHHNALIEERTKQRDILALLFFMAAVAIIGHWYVGYLESKIVSPCPKDGCIGVNIVHAQEPKSTSSLVDESITKYGKGKDQSHLQSLMHCLLDKESKHGANRSRGDSGKASGILQFHQPTYISFRKIMMKRGLVDYLGSRDNDQDAIETTVWALVDGRGSNWGPILRGECL